MLIFEPVAEGTGDNGSNHEVTLYFRPLAGRDTAEFYADARYGEFWAGPRPTLKEFSERYGLRTRDLSELELLSPERRHQGLAGEHPPGPATLIRLLTRWLTPPATTPAWSWSRLTSWTPNWPWLSPRLA